MKRVDLDERLQQLYCCSSMDIHAYRMDGSEVFSFLRSVSVPRTVVSTGQRSDESDL